MASRRPQPLRWRTSRARELSALAVDRLVLSLTGGGGVISRAPSSQRAVALSFDDGPSPHNTPELLDLLAEHGARATFFAVGEEVGGREAIVERTLAQGHELANHTYGHARTVHLTHAQLLGEVVRTNDILKSLGADVRLVRPPFGKDRRRFVDVAKRLGMKVALWSVDSKDTREQSPVEVAASVLRRLESGGIVLMHDGGERRPRTLEACSKILPELRRAGYRMTTISELLTDGPDPAESAARRLSPEHGDFVG